MSKKENVWMAICDGKSKWSEIKQIPLGEIEWSEAVRIAKLQDRQVRLSKSAGYMNQGHYIMGDKARRLMFERMNQKQPINTDMNRIQSGKLRTIKYERINSETFNIILSVNSTTTAVIGQVQKRAFDWLFSPSEYLKRRFIGSDVLHEIAQKIDEFDFSEND
jgi:hypothetical protein